MTRLQRYMKMTSASRAVGGRRAVMRVVESHNVRIAAERRVE